VPDDSWILRPQDLPDGFAPDGDTWYFSRVCGTFKERAGWHGCQMPERLLSRIITGCSNPGDLVLDPFAGSGTTLVVAKKLRRRFLGFELSPEYSAQIKRRLESTRVGQSLEGANPHESGKKTPEQAPKRTRRRRKVDNPQEVKQGVFTPFLATSSDDGGDRDVADRQR
jgi:site-specific DNA-methyltransferase (adenine-specific)